MSNAMSDARKKQDGTTTSSMTDAEFARYLHSNRLDWLRRFLGSAIRWRDVSRDCATAGARAQARRYMRQSALSWARHWRSL